MAVVEIFPLEKSKLEPRVIICSLVMVVGKLKRYRCLSKVCARLFGNKTRAALSCSIEQGARLVSRVRVECIYIYLSLFLSPSKTRVQFDGSRMCLVRWPGYSGSSLTTCPQVSLASFIRSSLVSGSYDRPNLFARLLRAIEIRISVSLRRQIRRY